MKKNILFMFLLAFCITFAYGCATVEVVEGNNLNGQNLSSGDTPVAHLHGENWGFYLFNIPLLTGSTDSPGNIAVFKDTVNANSMAPVVARKATELKAKKTLDMNSEYSNFGFIIYSRSVTVSANAVK